MQPNVRPAVYDVIWCMMMDSTRAVRFKSEWTVKGSQVSTIVTALLILPERSAVVERNERKFPAISDRSRCIERERRARVVRMDHGKDKR